MANLPESSIWESVVTQIDSGEDISGGSSGVANRALKQLVNRTKYLHDNLGSSDADTLDGHDSVYFATAAHNHDSDYLNESSNLSDLGSASSARSNLGLKNNAEVNYTTSTSAPSGGADGDVWYQV